jgi:hypothetical protein
MGLQGESENRSADTNTVTIKLTRQDALMDGSNCLRENCKILRVFKISFRAGGGVFSI